MGSVGRGLLRGGEVAFRRLGVLDIGHCVWSMAMGKGAVLLWGSLTNMIPL